MSERASTRRSARVEEMAQRDDSESDMDMDDEYEPPTKRRKTTARSRPQRRSVRRKPTQRQSKPQQPKLQQAKRKPRDKRKKTPYMKRIGAPLKSRKVTEDKYTGPSDNRIPDWTSLPLDILRDIFVFASQPMHEQTMTASARVGWLLRSARICRKLADPALEAYYRSPYPLTKYHPHYLLELLQMPQDKTYIDYAVKIRSLEIDIRRIDSSVSGKDKFDLSALVGTTPQLQHLEIVSPLDTAPYRGQQGMSRWKYPEQLFQTMDDTGIKLRSWRWNAEMIPGSKDEDRYSYMSLGHTSKSFDHLERLVVCNYGLKTLSYAELNEGTEPDKATVHPLAVTLSQLSGLKDLTFISCDVIMDTFLETLPKTLERLELSNCLEVTSDMLKSYLQSAGSQLRELVLNHNSALDLTFLPMLKLLCPRLEVLKMDFTYYSERDNYNDAWAMYDHLLAEDDVPMWPSTLRCLELVNLKKWSPLAAQNLFRSLVEGAKDLPDLRQLIIQAHISSPWRDRAQFRDQWIERLNKVYLRRSERPNPFLGSLKQFRLYKKAIAEGRVVVDTPDLDTDEEPTTRASVRLSHVRITPQKSRPEIMDEPSEAGPSSVERPQRNGARRSVRVAESASTAVEDNTTSDEDEDDSAEWSQQGEEFIQGLCETVDIRIDNQRPRENQFTEANFMDSELSGDEDWHSGAELSDDGYAW